MAQADYQRTNGATTVEKFIAEYEPQARLNDRTFAFGLGRWERDRMQGFDVRWSASGGLGYKIVDNKAMTLNLKAGPAGRHTNFLHKPNAHELTRPTGLDLGWQFEQAHNRTQTPPTHTGKKN